MHEMSKEGTHQCKRVKGSVCDPVESEVDRVSDGEEGKLLAPGELRTAFRVLTSRLCAFELELRFNSLMPLIAESATDA